MGYVGNEPSVNFTSFAKQDITGDGGTSYTLTHAVANANEIEVFVNNVRQEPTSAYSASGTALTMTGNVASTDDFYVIYLGKALQTTVPPDSSVTNAKIVNSTIDLTSKVTGVLPIANGGTGMSTAMAQQWRLSTTTNVGTNGDVTANWEVNDTSGYSGIGTGLTQSSGIFSFALTGKYLITFTGRFVIDASDDAVSFSLHITQDNSSYSEVAVVTQGNRNSGGTIVAIGSNSFIFNVTNTSNDKFKFVTSSFAGGSYLTGNTSVQRTGFVVMKLGA